MNGTRTALLKGAIKSAVASVTALIIGLPAIDPVHFNIQTLGGWRHIGIIVLWVVIVGEARFWNQWANSNSKNSGEVAK